MDRLTTWLWRYRGRILAGFVALLVVNVAAILMPLVVREAIDRLAQGEGDLLRRGLYIAGIAVVMMGEFRGRKPYFRRPSLESTDHAFQKRASQYLNLEIC